MATKTGKAFYREAKKWEQTLPDGSPNPGSYEAENANRLATWAWRIAEDERDGATNPELLEISRMLNYIVTKAASDFAGAPVGMGTALWSQAFWTLKPITEKYPVDFTDLETWTITVTKATYRLLALSKKILTETLDADGELIEPDFATLEA
jgi:hypothetical protein